MLVLSRKAGQRIHIGDDIVVEVRRVAGNRVTLALEAPRDVRILRGELQKVATEFEVELHEADEVQAIKVDGPHTTPFPAMERHVAGGNELVG
jgi:carbon storage regulator CsrA